ncbi:hypothetical protein C2E21_7575 [Chlorella sorokiniana]|uniref:Uncharacterized protein n=1 Tax=Chlorella sorokiniana TaxID=3076 RepID=A0A2P6TGV3_CHLSO|nr:hypothetical protein C2E21_7575 [Chlorella sorokiniana]|eukprot:PRW33519.1 hypothetical protein C2E21_7575 [Chlorella sorokiniana]
MELGGPSSPSRMELPLSDRLASAFSGLTTATQLGQGQAPASQPSCSVPKRKSGQQQQLGRLQQDPQGSNVRQEHALLLPWAKRRDSQEAEWDTHAFSDGSPESSQDDDFDVLDDGFSSGSDEEGWAAAEGQGEGFHSARSHPSVLWELPPEDGRCADGETVDVNEMEGDLDAMGAVDFPGLLPQAFPWAEPPVQGPGAAAPEAAGAGEQGGEQGGADDAGDSSGSDSEGSEGSGSSGSEGGVTSSSSSGSEGEAMDEDEEDEWFPGGDAGAY